MSGPERCRLRDLGVAVGGLPTGPLNAITDVPGVRVGNCTVSWGGPELPHGCGPARTGVTAVLPHGDDIWHERVVAGAFAANGVGEVIGISAIREWGLIETPVLLTNSQSAGDDTLVPDVVAVGQYGGDARAGGPTAVWQLRPAPRDGAVADAHAGHVGDGVQRAGGEHADGDAEVAQSAALRPAHPATPGCPRGAP